MEIIRTYNRKATANMAAHTVGTVTLVIPDGVWTLDGEELDVASIIHLAHFSLQTLQDAYAGKDEMEGAACWAKKRDALLNGTIGTRGDGTGASYETIVARSVMRNAAKLRFGAKSPQWATFTGLSDADQIAKLDAWLADKAGKKLEKAIAREIEFRREKAIYKADNGLDLDIEI